MPACPECNRLKYKLSVETFRGRVGKHIRTANRFGLGYLDFDYNMKPVEIRFYYEVVGYEYP